MSTDTSLIKQVRDLTGLSFAAIKDALAESGNDVEQAITILRKKGMSIVNKKSGNSTNVGVVISAVAGNRAALVEINTETDFAIRNQIMHSLTSEIQKLAPAANSLESLQQVKTSAGNTLEEEIKTCIATLGENVVLRRAGFLAVEQGALGSYAHLPVSKGIGNNAAIVSIESSAAPEKLADFANQLAMHIVAFDPIAISIDQVDPALVEKEKDIITEKAKSLNRPENIIPKIVESGLNTYYNQVVLLAQNFIANDKQTVQQAINDLAKELGHEIKVKEFIKYQVGK